MTTYSDRIEPLRTFLKAHDAQPNGKALLGLGDRIEQWNVLPGRPLIILIDTDGTWRACSPVSTSDEPNAREHLERYLMGQRPDLDLLGDMDRLSSTFLDKLSDMPACTDPKCGQATCGETRALRTAIENFRAKLAPHTKKEIANAVS